MFAADNGHDAYPPPAKVLGHFDRHHGATARRRHQRRIAGCEIEVAQNALRQAAGIFQEHRLPLTVRPDDEIVKAQ